MSELPITAPDPRVVDRFTNRDTLRKERWRFGHDVFMTLCIGAISRSEKRYFTVSDLMLSTEIMSAEATAVSKVTHIGHNPIWMAMYAGDPTHASQVSGQVMHALSGYQSTPFALVAHTYQAAFKQILEKKINDEVLNVYGMTREQFIKEGRNAFGDEEFGRIIYKISHTKLDTEFLIGNPTTLFSISDPGVIEYHDSLGFHAIGTGCILAQAWLYGLFDQKAPSREILYHLLEAKFRGERASGVGRKTFVTFTDETGTVREGFRPEDCEKIRAIWETDGQPKIPQAYFDFIGHQPELSLWPFKDDPTQ